MAIRQAVAADLADIEAMIVDLADFERSADEVTFDHEQMAEHLFGPDPAARVLIATPDDQPDRIAGMAVWFRTFSTWEGVPGVWLEDLFIRPAYRRLGLANQLLSALGERSGARVEWSVLDWNSDAIAFYDGLGATPVEGWTRYRWTPGRLS